MTYDATKIRVRDGWVVILHDERQVVLDSGIFLPGSETGAEKVTEGAGTLIRLGEGKKNTALELHVGDRVFYRSYLRVANAIANDETWPSGAPKEYFIMNVDDLMGVMPPGTKVGVFSRPAMTSQPKEEETT